jgi:hypothetical protein
LGDMGWIDLVQDTDQWRALMNTVMKFRVPYNVGKFLSRRPSVDFRRRTQSYGVTRCRIPEGSKVFFVKAPIPT